MEATLLFPIFFTSNKGFIGSKNQFFISSILLIYLFLLILSISIHKKILKLFPFSQTPTQGLKALI
jgi:hypothetical protein